MNRSPMGMRAEDSSEMEGARSATGVSEAEASPTGLAPRPFLTRRFRPKLSDASFTTEYKLRIVREAERCKGPGEVGALLRRLRLPELLGRVKRARARVPGAIKGRTALRPRAKAGVAARAPIGCEDEIGHGETPE